jgi:phosphatidylcholine synthase
MMVHGFVIHRIRFTGTEIAHVTQVENYGIMENYYDSDQANWSPTQRQKLLAWSAHLFTASGVIWGLLTLVAITNDQWILAFAWIGAAILVDSVDGLLARRVRVKEVLPEFDGALLDNIIDFLNYVFVPAFFLFHADMLPDSTGLIGPVIICLASSYQFCQNDAKTEDHFFKGFPSYWNIMVFYFLILGLSVWINFAIVVLLSILVFVPITYIYPSRTTSYQTLTLTFSAIWAIANIIIWSTYPNHAPWLVWISVLYIPYYAGMSLYATYNNRRMRARTR